MSKYEYKVDDEPTVKDHLGRIVYAEALAELIQDCSTPAVIGIHGDWGSGKTSLMQLIGKLLNTADIKTVWFNSWKHQFEDAPAIPLLHEIQACASHHGIKMEGLKLLQVVSTIAGETLLRGFTGGHVGTSEMIRLGEKFEKDYFIAETIGEKLQEHFQLVVDKIASNSRLVVFVDDLDRCLPSVALKMLEAIKLYLCANKCVYVIGVAREVVEQSVRLHYGELTALSGHAYLDKVIQLPFHIPPIHEDMVPTYLDSLTVDNDIKSHYGLLIRGVGRNPRKVKRFMNLLHLSSILAKRIIPDYKPHVLIKLLLFQFHALGFYKRIACRPDEFPAVEAAALKLRDGRALDDAISQSWKIEMESDHVRELLCLEPQIGMVDLKPYIHLSETTKSKQNIPRVCSHCGGGPLVPETDIDTWDGDSDGMPPKYEDGYRCKQCGDWTLL